MVHSHSHFDAQATAGTAATGTERARNRRRLVIVLALALGYAGVELVGGWLTGSLALLADALHMVADVAALALSVLAIWMASRPATERRTFGHSRAEILAALANGVGLAVVAIFISVNAVERFLSPQEVEGLGMGLVASGGLLVNLFALWLLRGGREGSLNVRGAWLHVASDTLASVGVILAGLGIWMLGWLWLDPSVAVGVSALVLMSAWNLVREALDVLMETMPGHLDPEEIRTLLLDTPGVRGLHCLHVWTIGSGETSLSSHLVIEPERDAEAILQSVRQQLTRRLGIEHTTIQIEPEEPTLPGRSACRESCEIGFLAPAAR